MAYGIIRAEKVKIAKLGSGLQEHHQRSDKDGIYNNPDIDLKLSKNNVEFIHSDNFRKSMNEVIKDHDITRKIRSDAVGLIDGFTTVSGDFFKDKTKEQIVSYFKGMLPLIEREFGPLISATLHCDEMKYNDHNYHMHFATVPIINDEKGNYCLSAKKVMGNQKDYIARQDRFYDEYFKGFGLDRGLSAKETKAEHISANRWKAEQVELKAEQAESKTKQEKNKLRAIQDREDKVTTNLIAIESELNKQKETISKQNETIQDNSSVISEQNKMIQNNNMMVRSQNSTIDTNKKTIQKQESKKQTLKDDVEDLLKQINVLQNQKQEINDWFDDNEDTTQALIDKRALDLIYEDNPDLAESYINKACDILNGERTISIEYEEIER